jgi:hypothetical protein
LFAAHAPPLLLMTCHAVPSPGIPDARKRKLGGGSGVPRTPSRTPPGSSAMSPPLLSAELVLSRRFRPAPAATDGVEPFVQLVMSGCSGRPSPMCATTSERFGSTCKVGLCAKGASSVCTAA